MHEGNPAYPQWLACETDCDALLEVLLATGLADFWHFVQSDAFGLAVLFGGGMSQGEILNYIEGLLLEADVLDRAALLALLDRTPGLGKRALPAPLYEELAGRNPVEARLILSRHVTVPLADPHVVEEVGRLAVDPDAPSSLRYRALAALGHEANASLLVDTVRSMLEAGEAASLMDRAATASARCGWACRDAFRAMLRSADVEVRTAAYRGLTAVSGRDRTRVRAYLEAEGLLGGPATSSDPEERFARERAMRLLAGL